MVNKGPEIYLTNFGTQGGFPKGSRKLAWVWRIAKSLITGYLERGFPTWNKLDVFMQNGLKY